MGREGVGKGLGNGQNIAIGTTNPGYWVLNGNYGDDHDEDDENYDDDGSHSALLHHQG